LLTTKCAKLRAKLTVLPGQRAKALTKILLLAAHSKKLCDVCLTQLTKLKTKLALLLRPLQTKVAHLIGQVAHGLTALHSNVCPGLRL
jgi:hypothetical protein